MSNLKQVSVAVGQDETHITTAIPTGLEFVGAWVKDLGPAVEPLGLNGAYSDGANIIQSLRGSDTAGGQHEVVFQFQDSGDFNEDLSLAEIATKVTTLEGCISKICSFLKKKFS
jgi:hypothetical protein